MPVYNSRVIGNLELLRVYEIGLNGFMLFSAKLIKVHINSAEILYLYVLFAEKIILLTLMIEIRMVLKIRLDSSVVGEKNRFRLPTTLKNSSI